MRFENRWKICAQLSKYSHAIGNGDMAFVMDSDCGKTSRTNDTMCVFYTVFPLLLSSFARAVSGVCFFFFFRNTLDSTDCVFHFHWHVLRLAVADHSIGFIVADTLLFRWQKEC